MNLKKIGGALTAISMIASMATYLPAAVSAAEAQTTVFPGKLELYPDVSFVLDTAENTLTLKPTTDGAVYEIPAGVLGEIAYEFVGVNENLDTTAEITGKAVNIVIEGPAVINVGSGTKLSDTGSTTSVKADCRAVIKDSTTSSSVTDDSLKGLSANTSTGSVTGKVLHDFEANTTYQNHVCKNCEKIDTSFDAHDFTKDGGAKINTKDNTHTCACGKVDTDYLVTNANGTYDMASSSNYRIIHGFTDTGSHYCEDCGAYDVTYHQGTHLTYVKDATGHTVTCKDKVICNYAEAKQAHNIVPYSGELEKVKGSSPLAITAGDNTNITETQHYCTVCGYVPEADKTVHDFSYKYEPYFDDNGAPKLRLVPATVESEKVVCKCGAVKPGHGTTTTHKYVAANGQHVCACGEVQTNHSYCYEFTGTGAYTVNGKTGYIQYTNSSDISTKGLVCECGLIKDGLVNSKNHYSGTHLDAQHAVYVDKTNQQHYCSCGQVIMDGTKPAHYYSIAKNEKHTCECGAVASDNSTATPGKHVYDSANNGSYFIKAYNKALKCDELVEMKTGVDYEAYQESSDSETAISFSPSNTVICECGKVNPAHEHIFNIYIDQVHYCACGEKSTEHTYNQQVSGVDNMKCACGNVKDHTECIPTSSTDCTCKICGKVNHTLKKYGTNSHICVKCGTPVAKHEYECNKTTNKHVCSICGFVAADTEKGLHTFGTEGTAKCICQECGYSKHNEYASSSNVDWDSTAKVHKCTVCGATVDHKYGANYHCVFDNYSGTTAGTLCGKVKTHTCAFAKNADASGTDYANNTYAQYDELCACGKKLEHSVALGAGNASENAEYHGCVHYAVVTEAPSSGSATTTTAITTCVVTNTHAFSETVDTDTTVTYAFCADGCGAVNPTLLDTARNLNVATQYLNTHSASFIVNISKAKADLLEYDIAETGSAGTYTYKDDANDIAAIKTVTNTTEKAEFEATLKAFNDLYAAADDNQAGATVKIMPYEGGISNANDLKYEIDEDEANMYSEASAVYTIKGKSGSAITLKVVPKAGYKFEGWYEKNDGTATAIGTDASLTVTLKDGTKNYFAKVVQNDKVTINIGEGVKAIGSVTNTTGDYSDVLDQKYFVKGEEITLSAPNLSGASPAKVFIGFKDSTGKYLKNTTDKTTFYECKVTATSNETYTAVYVTPFSDDNCYVTFAFDGNALSFGKLTKTSGTTWDASEKAEMAGTPYLLGHTFNGWVKADSTSVPYALTNDPTANESNANVVKKPLTDRIKTKQIKSSDLTTADQTAVYVPLFTKNIFKVTLDGAVFVKDTDAEAIKNGFAVGTQVGVVADEMRDGKYFSGWYINGVKSDETRTAFRYTVTNKDVTIKAEYKGTAPLEEKTLLAVTGSNSYVDGVRNVDLVFDYNFLAKDGKFVKAGILFAPKGATEAQLKAQTSGLVYNRQATGTANKGTFGYSVKLKSDETKNATLTAIGYVIYTDANGVQQYAYSDMVSIAK